MKNDLNTVKNIKNQSVLSDLAIGFEPEIEVPQKWELLDRYQQSGFNYLGLAIAGEFTSLETAIRYISSHRAQIHRQADKYVLVKEVKDILTAKQENKLALSFWLQGANPLANDMHMVETYYQLGIRYILLCYNKRNAVGDGVIEKANSGLSQFGFKLIEEMNRVGMIIDLSHAGINTSLDAIEASRDPVIFSHSNAYKITPHVRNLNDEQIKAVARKSGIIGINGNALLLGEEKSTNEKIVKHIEYISDLVGPEYISLGLDPIYFHEILESFYKKAGETTYPKNYLGSMDSYQPEKIDGLIDLLLQRGFSQSAILGILGNNFLRVAEKVWKSSRTK